MRYDCPHCGASARLSSQAFPAVAADHPEHGRLNFFCPSCGGWLERHLYGPERVARYVGLVLVMLSALPGLLMQQSDRLPWVAGSWIGYALVWLGLLWYLRDQQRWSVHARLRDVAPHRAPPSATAAKPGLRRDCPYCGATLSKLNLQHRRARERPHSFLVPVALCCRNCQGEVVNRLHPMEQVVAAVSAIFLAGFMLSAVLYALRRPESWQPFLSWGVPLMVLLCAGVAVVHRRMGTMDWQRFEPDPATLRPPRFEDGNAQASRPVDPPTA